MSTDQAELIRVLVVDELTETAKVIEVILKKSGNCEVSHTDHPSKAGPMVTAGEIDLVLCEAFNGSDASLEFCRSLKGDSKFEHIPVIFYSGIHDRQTMLKGFDAGAVDYLFKPLFPMELAARVKTHFQLKKQKDLTMDKVRQQRELIHIMCHDLTGPVSASLALLELSKDDSDMLSECYDAIVKSMGKAIELTDLVRQLQAIEEGKKQLDLAPLNLKEAVADAASIFKDRMEKKSLTIDEQISPDISVLVERVSFINSVVANLLSNAIKFSQPNSAITFTASPIGDKVILKVTDTGIGMPEPIREHLFNISVPTSREGTAQEVGTGFGMPLVKKFVNSYNGEIEVFTKDIDDNPDDHGTTMQITLQAG